MAIPNNYIDKITKGNDSRYICPAADKVRVNNENFEGTDMDDVLDEIAESISGAGGGTVESVTINGTKHTPDSQGDVDLGTITGAKGDKGDKGDTVVIDPSQVEQFDIINGLNAQSAGDALDAYQGAQLKAKINEVYTRLKAVYSALGNIAFWDGKPAASTILPDLDWGLPKHIVTLDLSLTNAVVKHNGAAVADGATIQVEEYTALTLLVEAESGYTLQSVTSSTTGAAVTDNGNGTYNVALTMGQSNVTLAITATAAQAYTISYGTMTNCSVVTSPAPTSILGGQSVEIEFSVGSGYELDSSCFTVANADKSWSSSTNKLTISNATGNVTISATASLPKLKFLKYYWMYWTGTKPYPSKASAQGFYGKFAVSDFIKVPQMTISASTKWKVYYAWAAQDNNVRPLIMSYYKLENGQYTYLANKTSDNKPVNQREWTMSDANIINACAAGTLYVRLTLGMNTNDGTGAALHADGYATVGGTDIFRVGDNYRLVDEQDWDVDELNLS